MNTPPEILQTIFRSLPIYDLLRCRRVCKTWHATLPGNDPSLCATLFTPSRPALVAAPNATPRLTFTMNVKVFLMSSDCELPELGFNIIFIDKVKRTNMPEGRDLHPLIWEFPTKTGIVNKHFLDWDRPCPSIAFKCFEHLEEILVRKNYLWAGNWKGQLVCVPPLEQVVLQMDWFQEKGHGEIGRKKRSMRTRKMKRGVTVGEVVRTVREMLAVYAVEDVKRVCKDLQIMGCGMCQDLYDDAVGVEISSDEGEDTAEEEDDEEEMDKA
jgi:hypothetical protein